MRPWLKQAPVRWALLLSLIFGLAFALRLYGIGQQSFWIDEVFTLKMSTSTWAQMHKLTDTLDNGKPPLYYCLMHYWLRGGDSEAWARLPSAIFGSLTCVVASGLGVSFLGRRGWIMGLLLAVSPFHIWYSQEARMYTLLGLFGSLAFYFHHQFCRDGKWRDISLFAFFGILTCYTFPYGFFFLPVTAICAILYRPFLGLGRLKIDAGAHLVVFGAFSLWIPRIVHAVIATAQDYKGQHLQVLGYTVLNLFLGSSIGFSPNELRQHGLQSFSLYPGPGLLFFLAFVVSILVFFSGLKVLARENWNALVFVVAGSIVLIGAPFLIALVKSSVTNNPRYAFLALSPLLLAVTAFFLHAGARASWFHRCVAGLFAGLTVLSLVNYYEVPDYGRDNMRAAANYLMADNFGAGDVIFLCDPADLDTLQHYYHGSASIVRLGFPVRVSEAQEQAKIQASVAGSTRLALVYLRPDHGDPRRELPRLFKSLFREIEEKSWAGVTCYRFEAALPAAHP